MMKISGMCNQKNGVIMNKLFLLAKTVGLVILLTAGTLWAAPDLFVVQDTYEFESVPEGKVLTHAFVVQNRGDAPLHIQSVRTG